MATIPCRLIEPIGVIISLRRYWDNCPSTPLYQGKHWIHNAERKIYKVRLPMDKIFRPDGIFLDPKEWLKMCNTPAPTNDDPRWPIRCYQCGVTEIPADANRQLNFEEWWNTPDGKAHPGDMTWVKWKDWFKYPERHCWEWDNCTDPRGHLEVMLPDGHWWDIDGRATNCTMKGDRMHRCWVRKGEPPNVHVDKGGNTCSAGAGSIATGGYHGFLQQGKLVSC